MAQGAEIYLGLCVALYYTASCSLHLAAHFQDGVNIVRDTSHKSRIVKTCLCLAQAIASFLLLIWLHTGALSTLTHGLFLVVWTESAVTVEFDYRRWLAASWASQRSLWPASFLLHSLLSLTSLPDFQQITYLCMTLISAVLTYLAISKPNDYILINQSQQMMENLLLRPLFYSQKTSSSSIAESQLSVSLSVCKVKRLRSNIQLDYRFIVNVAGVEHHLKVNTSDLEQFDQKMSEQFSLIYPLMDFPRLPKPHNQDIDSHSKQIEAYITTLCKPEYRSEAFFDFLRIPQSSRDLLSTPLVRFIDMYECISLSGSSSDGNGESLPCCDEAVVRFVSCGIEGWTKVEAQRPYIVYRVRWVAVGMGFAGRAEKRFSDFYQLHKAIKACIGDAKAPEFPSKNYIKSLIGELDNHALDLRRQALESYLCYVVNDPAYLCAPLLSFLNCPIGLEALWGSRPVLDPVSVVGRVNWNTEVGGDESCYFAYSMMVIQGENQWQVTHRYSEFDSLHQALSRRLNSTVLAAYMSFRHMAEVGTTPLPTLPQKTLTAISTMEEIESRREGLEHYIKALVSIPCVQEAYAFRAFLRSSSNLPLPLTI